MRKHRPRKEARRFWRTKLRPWWQRLRWPAFLVLTLATLYLGYVGFAGLSAATGQNRSFWDLVYLSLQLFTLESGSAAGPKGWELELARFLAPTLAAYAALSALMVVLRSQVNSFRLRLAKAHVVICGLGRKGFLLAKEFLKQGDRVVIIDKDEDNPFLDPCRDLGAIPVIGHAAQKEILEKARITRAKHLISVCPDDGINVEAAVRACELVQSRKESILSCFAHIVDPQLFLRLKEQEIISSRIGAFEWEFFNIYDSGARELLKKFPPFPSIGSVDSIQPPHMIVVGLGRMGRSLVVHAGRNWRPFYERTGLRLRITVIDLDAERKAQWLAGQYPRLEKICEIQPRVMDVRSPSFQDAGFLSSPPMNDNIPAIFVCLGNDSLGLAAALAIHQKIGKRKIMIVVRLTQEAGLAALLRKTAVDPDRFVNCHAFSLLEQTCRPDLVLGGIHETIAGALHQAYVEKEIMRGQSMKTNPSLVPWEELPVYLRESNRYQANHIGIKLKAVNCRITLLTDWDAELFRFTPQEIEILARMEHERWMDDLKSRRWTYKKGRKNQKKKTHPDLISWDKLIEEVKEKDRLFIRELPRILAGVDLQVERIPRDLS